MNNINIVENKMIETEVNLFKEKKFSKTNWLLSGKICYLKSKLMFLFIACSLNNDSHELKDKLFHFLPRNGINLGLPIQLNANFQVNSSRNALLYSESHITQSKENEIIFSMLPQLYLNLLKKQTLKNVLMPKFSITF